MVTGNLVLPKVIGFWFYPVETKDHLQVAVGPRGPSRFNELTGAMEFKSFTFVTCWFFTCS